MLISKSLLVALSFFLFNTSSSLADAATETATPSPQNHSVNSSDTLTLHKPATDPSWGRVIQFQQEQSVSAGDRSKETIYKFLFQDSQGVIRLATYHETGDSGYWEVWIWDQP